MVAVALVVGRHGDDFLNRLADAPVFQRLGLLEPLLADAGGGLHAVAVAQLLLGRVLAGQFAGQRAGCVKADLVLRDIEAHGGDLARVVQLQRAHGRVNGHAAGLVGLSARAGHGGDGTEAGSGQRAGREGEHQRRSRGGHRKLVHNRTSKVNDFG